MPRASRDQLPFGEAYASHPIIARTSKTCGVTWSLRSKGRREQIGHYFIDEAGDAVLWHQGGRLAAGSDGCSRYFILGLTWVLDPIVLERDLSELRASVLADPYFARVPSMQPDRRKTALFFHAKDDVPEVRHQVFRLLQRHPLQFFAVIRDKDALVAGVNERQRREPGYRYQQNHVYDEMVQTLTRERLHRDAGYAVQFATRGTSDRTAALRAALDSARLAFARKWGVTSNAPIDVAASSPQQSAGLQATDYLLWALQRCLERGEDRYLEFAWPAVRLIYDLDDVRTRPYGEHYGQNRRLTAATLEGRRRRI